MEIGEVSITKILKDYLPSLIILFVLIVPLIIKEPKIGIFLITFLIPISPSASVGETELRSITLRFEDFIFLITLLSWGLRKFRVPKSSGHGYSVLKILLVFAAVHFFSTAWNFSALKQKSAVLFLAKYTQYWLYFIMAYSLIKGREEAKVVLLFYFLGVSLALAYWLNQIIIHGKIGNMVRFPFHKMHGGRENVGIFCFGIMAFSLPFLLSTKNKLYKVLLLLFFVSASVVYLRTLSRASYLAGIAWITFILLFLKRKDIFLTVLAIISVFPFIAPDYVIDRIKYTFEGGGGGTVLGSIYLESSAFVRLGRWKYFLLEQMPEKPIIGYGVTGLGLMDNQYLRVWGETGTVGFLIFVFLLHKLFKLFYETYKKSKKERDDFLNSFSIGMLGWFVGILFHMIPANTFVILQTSEMFWILSGTLAAVERAKVQNFFYSTNFSNSERPEK